MVLRTARAPSGVLEIDHATVIAVFGNWNRAGQLVLSPSFAVAVRRIGEKLGVAGTVAGFTVTVGTFTPQEEVLNEKNVAEELLPNASVIVTTSWYEPASSGTKLGDALVAEPNCEALPAGAATTAHWKENGCTCAPHAAFGSENAAVKVTSAPTFGFAGGGDWSPRSGSTTLLMPIDVAKSAALPQVATDTVRKAGAEAIPRELVATTLNW
jgi:hypothetical protein